MKAKAVHIKVVNCKDGRKKGLMVSWISAAPACAAFRSMASSAKQCNRPAASCI